MLPINPNCTLHEAHLHDIVCYKDDSNIISHHPGTDGRETQWEIEALVNFRSVLQLNTNYWQIREWDGLIEQIIGFYHDYHIHSFYIQEGQSLPILLKTDSSMLSSRNSNQTTYDIMNGSVVLLNEECGYWSYIRESDKPYPNPYLVKLTRKVYELCPQAILSSSCKNNLF